MVHLCLGKLNIDFLSNKKIVLIYKKNSTAGNESKLVL